MEEQVVEMHPFKEEASNTFRLKIETERRRELSSAQSRIVLLEAELKSK
jgi:hypothetical protein